MANILTPGYLRWDGSKYVLDQDIEIVGPTGSAGPTGPTGSQGTPGIGVGATATGDLNGTYPNPITVVGLTGVSGVVSFGNTVTNPFITQTATSSATGNSFTLKAQNATTTGGSINIQSGTGTTAGLIQFLSGNTTVGQFDANGAFRIGPQGSANAPVFGSSAPVAGNDILYSFNTANVQSSWRLVSSAVSNRAVIEAINSSSGISSSIALRIMASGTGEATTNFAGNGILEQVGSSNSALVFSKALGDLTSRGTTGRIWQTGAWSIGDTATNNSSSSAQAGLTGPVLNVGAATGTFTSAANQALLFNIAGSAHLQGASDVRFDVGTNLAGYFDSNRVFRAGKNSTTSSTILGTSFPRASNDAAYICSTSEESGVYNFTQLATATATIGTFNTAAGTTSSNGIGLWAAGLSYASFPAYQGHGTIEQVGSATSAMLFSKVLGDGTSRGVNGRIYQTGAWGLGDSATNNTSTLAQAGLTGPLLNLSATTGGTMTTNTNQALLFNTSGTMSVQGNVGVNFIASTTTAASVTATKFVTSVGRRVKVTTTTANYGIQTTDEVISVGTLASSITLTMPASPTTGDTYNIKDANGSAAAFNIIVTGNGNNIDANASFTLSTNFSALTLVYNGTKWIIV